MFKVSLLLHILGAIGIFVSLALFLYASASFRFTKTTQQAERLISSLKIPQLIIGASSVTLLLTGFYMSWILYNNNRPIGWIVISLVAFVLLGFYSSKKGEKEAEKITKIVRKNNKNWKSEIQKNTSLKSSVYSISVTLGIVILMVIHPSVLSSIIILLASLIFGWAINYYLWTVRDSNP